jgi:hypothetical protein
MSSTYSPSLKLELIGNGDQSGTWGTTTNNNLGTLLEQAITGVQAITMSNTDYTLSNFNGTSDEARNAVLVVSGTNSAIRKIVAPQGQNKTYTVFNNTTGGYAITIGAPTGTAVTIPSGITAQVYTDGANFYTAISGSSGNFNVPGNLTVAGNGIFSGTGAVTLPVGTTAQEPGSPTQGMIRFNSQTSQFEGYNGATWASVGGGATGGGGDQVFVQNQSIITTSYTLSTGFNAESVGPITVNSGATVTIPSGQRWVIL